MTTEQIALEILQLTTTEMDEVMEYIYDNVDPESYNEMLLGLGLDVSGWCKRKHPPAE